MASAKSIADQLAASSLTGARPQDVACDRSLAPTNASCAVALPPCFGCAYGSRRAAAVTASDNPHFFTDLIAPACWSAMSADDRDVLTANSLLVARKAIDRVSGGAARVVGPGFEDVACIASADERANVMLALGWLAATCGCLQALMESLPDDTPPGVYVRAGSKPPTADQLADTARAYERRRSRSAWWSAHLSAKAQQRRRPPIGDLFPSFDFDAWDRLTHRPLSSPAS